jgi:hypothetical protein
VPSGEQTPEPATDVGIRFAEDRNGGNADPVAVKRAKIFLRGIVDLA